MENDQPEVGKGRQRRLRKKKGQAKVSGPAKEKKGTSEGLRPGGRPGASRQRREVSEKGRPEPPQGSPTGTAANQVMDDLFGPFQVAMDEVMDDIVTDRQLAAVEADAEAAAAAEALEALAAPAAKKKPKKAEQSALVVVDDDLTLTDYTTGEAVPATAGKVVVTLNNIKGSVEVCSATQRYFGCWAAAVAPGLQPGMYRTAARKGASKRCVEKWCEHNGSWAATTAPAAAAASTTPADGPGRVFPLRPIPLWDWVRTLHLNPEFMPASMDSEQAAEASDSDEGAPFLLIRPEEAKVEEAVTTAREEAAAAVAQAQAEVASATAVRETALERAAQADAARTVAVTTAREEAEAAVRWSAPDCPWAAAAKPTPSGSALSTIARAMTSNDETTRAPPFEQSAGSRNVRLLPEPHGSTDAAKADSARELTSHQVLSLSSYSVSKSATLCWLVRRSSASAEWLELRVLPECCSVWR